MIAEVFAIFFVGLSTFFGGQPNAVIASGRRDAFSSIGVAFALLADIAQVFALLHRIVGFDASLTQTCAVATGSRKLHHTQRLILDARTFFEPQFFAFFRVLFSACFNESIVFTVTHFTLLFAVCRRDIATTSQSFSRMFSYFCKRLYKFFVKFYNTERNTLTKLRKNPSSLIPLLGILCTKCKCAFSGGEKKIAIEMPINNLCRWLSVNIKPLSPLNNSCTAVSLVDSVSAQHVATRGLLSNYCFTRNLLRLLIHLIRCSLPKCSILIVSIKIFTKYSH